MARLINCSLLVARTKKIACNYPLTFFSESNYSSEFYRMDVKTSTEYISLEDGSQYGPDLPEPLQSHCFVKTGREDMAIAMFGHADPLEPNWNTYFFNFTRQSWSDGPIIIQARM